MVNVQIVDMDMDIAKLMAQKMRPVDVFECRQTHPGVTLVDAMRNVCKISSVAKAAFVDGDLLCCWGRVNYSVLSGECSPWMLATTLINERAARREFLRQSPKIIDELTGRFVRSWNIVYEGNRVTIRWLKWSGFEFSDDPIILDGHRFLKFEKRNTVNVP